MPRFPRHETIFGIDSVTQSEVKNLAASVRARLANLARAQKEDFQELLSRYARERLLYRLSVSDYQERFVLKGALLFAYWTGAPHRPTRDMDLLGQGPPEIALLEKVFSRPGPNRSTARWFDISIRIRSGRTDQERGKV